MVAQLKCPRHILVLLEDILGLVAEEEAMVAAGVMVEVEVDTVAEEVCSMPSSFLI